MDKITELIINSQESQLEIANEYHDILTSFYNMVTNPPHANKVLEDEVLKQLTYSTQKIDELTMRVMKLKGII